MISHAYLKLYPSRVFGYLKHIQVYAPAINLSHCKKMWEDLQFRLPAVSPFFLIEQRRAQVNNATIPWKIFFYWIPFNEKDEKLPMARLDDTAIPHIKIKITKIPLEKKLNTAIPMCPSIQTDLYIFYYTWPSTILWLGKWLNCRHKSSNSQVVQGKFFHFLFSFHCMKPIDSMLS